jgi:hypothetical protein
MTEEPTQEPDVLPDGPVISQDELRKAEAKQQEEQQEKLAADMVLPAQLAQHLVLNEPKFGQVVASMLASRQLYAMCMYELDMLCETTDFKEMSIENVDLTGLEDFQIPMVQEILINSASVQAQAPFDEKLLFNGMVKTVFPWMQRVTVEHTKKQESAQSKKFDEMNSKRIATELAMGVQWHETAPSNPTADDAFRLQRGRPVMLAGWEPAVRWLLDFITEEAVSTDSNNVNQVLRLNSGGKPKSQDSRIWYVPKSDWENVASTNVSFNQLYAGFADNLVDPVDLLIVDDLRHATPSHAFLPMHSVVNEGQKRFKRWSEAAGCLVIGCILLPRDLQANELHRPEYETLRIHNVLRSVEAKLYDVKGVDWYKITVGLHEVAHVSAEELDAYIPKTIIEP